MRRTHLDKTPFLIAAIAILMVFFLSCTKKPQTAAPVSAAAVPGSQNSRQPASGYYTTPHGFKVQIEPVVITPQPQKK
jgi:hypothetical protein